MTTVLLLFGLLCFAFLLEKKKKEKKEKGVLEWSGLPPFVL